jgi:hypothetical protein
LISSPIVFINGSGSVQLGAHTTDQSDGSIFKKTEGASVISTMLHSPKGIFSASSTKVDNINGFKTAANVAVENLNYQQ